MLKFSLGNSLGLVALAISLVACTEGSPEAIQAQLVIEAAKNENKDIFIQFADEPGSQISKSFFFASAFAAGDPDRADDISMDYSLAGPGEEAESDKFLLIACLHRVEIYFDGDYILWNQSDKPQVAELDYGKWIAKVSTKKDLLNHQVNKLIMAFRPGCNDEALDGYAFKLENNDLHQETMSANLTLDDIYDFEWEDNNGDHVLKLSGGIIEIFKNAKDLREIPFL